MAISVGVSIPQAVSTVATPEFDEEFWEAVEKFQYRKR